MARAPIRAQAGYRSRQSLPVFVRYEKMERLVQFFSHAASRAFTASQFAMFQNASMYFARSFR